MTVHVVVPCFNEELRWNPAYWEELVGIEGFRWIFVDDGSDDRTAELARTACGTSASLVLTQGTNGGKAEAVRAGLIAAIESADPGDVVGFMDADGAFSRTDVERLSNIFGSSGGDSTPFDSLWSSRVALAGRDIDRSTTRHYLGRIAATILSLNDTHIPYDTQSGFKLFRVTPEFSQVLRVPFETRWLFEMEMLTRFREVNGRHMRIWEEPLLHWRDVPGSKVSAREVVRIGREILTVKRASGKKSKLPAFRNEQD